MATPLTMAPQSENASRADSESDSWQRFLVARDGLVSRMSMHICDGCDGCGLRCMDGFKVSRTEREAVEAYLASQPPEEVERIARQEKVVPWPGAEDTGVTVTFCRYRDMENERCSVYPARPTICRLFGHTPWLPCPIEAVPEVPEGSPELWRDYLAFERRTWDEWDAEDSRKEIP
ncbi:MAG: YkgJ family cysteine cluster protein [Armatimonadota bacterium]